MDAYFVRGLVDYLTGKRDNQFDEKGRKGLGTILRVPFHMDAINQVRGNVSGIEEQFVFSEQVVNEDGS